MAVVNEWANSNLEAGKPGNPAKVFGGKILCLVSEVEVAEADDDGSIYKLGRLPANAIPIRCSIFNDAIADATDYDLGLYEENGTDAADADLFMDGVDINAGNAIGSAQNGLAAGPSIDEMNQKVWELLGKTLANKKEGYVLALTANTVGSADGTISVVFEYILG